MNRLARRLPLLVALLLAVALRAEPLTVATYNVENYLSLDRRVDGVFRPDHPKPESEKTALRTVIRSLRADVLALQEMGGPEYLEELQRDLRSEGLDYPHAAIMRGADEERCVAVLSRRPLRDVRKHDDLDFAYEGGRKQVSRGLLEVTVQAGGQPLRLFVVHLKSRLTTEKADPESARWRAGEAVEVRDRVLEREPDPAKARFIILGDFNDTKASRPMRAMLKRGDTTIAVAVEAADSRGEHWTHHYAREDVYSRVDNILVSPPLQGRVTRAWIAEGGDVEKASDHRPVAATLDL